MASNFYRARKNRLIYAFVCPTKKQFYIWHCLEESLDETYRHHVKGRRDATRAFMDAVKPHRPCVFVLEELPRATIPKAYAHVLVWMKIMMEQGYTSFNYETSIEQAEHLYYEQNERYLERRECDMNDLLVCDRCEKPVFKNMPCPFYGSRVPTKK